MKIVVGYTPTPEGRAALARAITEATALDATLSVINTSHGDRYADPRFADPEALAELHGTLDGSGLSYEVSQPVRGLDPAEELISAAEADDVDMLVIGLRHRTAVGKLLLGSTSQRVILSAPCPVLAVKA